MSLFKNKIRKTPNTVSLISPLAYSSTPKPSLNNENREDFDEKFLSSYINQKKIKHVSNLQENSLKDLQTKESNNIEKTDLTKQNNRAIRSKTSSSQLRLSTDTAEYHDEYYLGGKQKYSLNGGNSGYKAFTQKLIKNCFDKDGNLIYPQDKEKQTIMNNTRERMKSDDLIKTKIMNAKQDEKIFLNSIENKVKNTNESFIVNIIRDLAKVDLHNKDRITEKTSVLFVDESKGKILENIKNKSINSLQETIKYAKTNQNLVSAQDQIEKNYKDMKRVLDQTLSDHKKMTEIYLKQEKNFVEIQTENEHLMRKNQILSQELNNLKKKMETLNENYQKISKFESSYELLNRRLPNYSLEKVLDKLEYLEKAGMDFTKKLGELEDEKSSIEKEKQTLIQKYEQRYIDLTKREAEAERKITLANEELSVKSDLIKEAHKYKEDYFLLFKNVIALFTEWNKEIQVYFNPNVNDIVEPQASLDDPLEILAILKKMVRISTSQSLQKYLRKIIVSANQLQREFFPNCVNEQFDPDKIYERIFKMLKNLKKENERLKVSNRTTGKMKSNKANSKAQTANIFPLKIKTNQLMEDKMDEELF